VAYINDYALMMIIVLLLIPLLLLVRRSRPALRTGWRVEPSNSRLSAARIRPRQRWQNL